MGEDGLAGLGATSRAALDQAQIVFGGLRHLALAQVFDRGRCWPVPFDVAPVLACQGRPVAVLASGDPFWFGVGGTLAQHLNAAEWVAYPQPSTFSLVAARLGWRLEDVACVGLHAAPFERLLPILNRGVRAIVLLRDPPAVAALCHWLTEQGWGQSPLTVLSCLGGPRETMAHTTAAAGIHTAATAPVAVALQAQGQPGLPRVAGLADDLFVHDGQITKRQMRALALSALAPRTGERLWDIGAGAGSIAIEWALAGGTAAAIEHHAPRAANIRINAERFGVAHRIETIEGTAPDALAGLALPDAVFVGGGLTAAHFDALWHLIPSGTRLVAHAVTLETQALLMELHGRLGGQLDRFEISHAHPLGRLRSWEAARPIVQWSIRNGERA